MASIIKPDSPSKAEKKPLVEEINRTQKSDPSINTDKLPDDHPIHLFPEAKEFYRDSRPPFVLNKHAKVTRTVVVPTQDGLRPQFPKKVEVIAKPYIVKPFTGNSQGGAKYLAWGGPGRDFEQKALVLSDNRQPSHRSSPELNQPSSESSTHASFNRLNQIQSSRRSSRRLNLIGSEFENETAEALVHAPVPLDIGAGNPSQPIGNDVCPDPASHKTMAKLALKNGKRTSRPSEVSIQIPFGAQSRHSSPEATGTKGRPVVPGSPSAKRRKTESSNGETNHLSSASPAPCRSKNQTAVTPASKVDARKISEGVAKSSISNSIAHPCQPQHPSTELHQRKRNATPVPSPQTVDLSVLLPRHKQDRTILIVRVAHSLEFQPLRLGDCMTLETFYAKVLGVWNVAEENVAKITVTFKWMSVEDSMRTMVMNRSQDACLTFLIGQVDDAPCWMDEKGKCILDVGIVLKE